MWRESYLFYHTLKIGLNLKLTDRIYFEMYEQVVLSIYKERWMNKLMVVNSHSLLEGYIGLHSVHYNRIHNPLTSVVLEVCCWLMPCWDPWPPESYSVMH